MTTHAAIPTTYKGHRFRSRLEARWAAWFDLLGWRWEYEPIDLPGWIPDFMIFGWTRWEGQLGDSGPLEILVEVKPTTTLEGFDLDKMGEAVEAVYGQRWDENRTGEILLLGQSPTLPMETEAIPIRLGWIMEQFPDGWDQTEAGFTDHHDGYCRPGPLPPHHRYGYASVMNCYACRICGKYDGWPEIHNTEGIRSLWAEAGNATRWRRPR